MNPVQLSLLRVLSDPTVSEEEFKFITRWLREGGTESLVSIAESVRAWASAPAPQARSSSTPSEPVKPHQRSGRHDRLAIRLSELLLQRLGMTVKDAVAELATRLEYRQPLPVRKSFNTYVKRLAEAEGDSAVLSAAFQMAQDRGLEDFRRDWAVDFPTE